MFLFPLRKIKLICPSISKRELSTSLYPLNLSALGILFLICGDLCIILLIWVMTFNKHFYISLLYTHISFLKNYIPIEMWENVPVHFIWSLTVLGCLFVCLSFFKIKKMSSYNVSAGLHITRILAVLILTDVTLALITSEIHF